MDFGTKQNILYKLQSGFWKFLSVDSFLSYLQDKVRKEFNSGLLTGLMLIDLRKAFVTIDHNILAEKMKCMGFPNDVTNWFEYYLSKRMFRVHVKNIFSDKALIICGVPPRIHFRATFVVTLQKWYGTGCKLLRSTSRLWHWSYFST